MSDFIQQWRIECAFRSSDSWVILSPIEQSIKRKIEAVGTPLEELEYKYQLVELRLAITMRLL